MKTPYGPPRKGMLKGKLLPVFSILGLLAAGPALADNVLVQCPGDNNGDAIIDIVDANHPNATCRHLTAGDGFSTMGDGSTQYIFGFADVTGVPIDEVMHAGMLAAELPSPPIVLDEGDELYLTLTNVGMMMRPDLFDPHTVHFHGFPNASSVFDGVPEASVSINMGASLTYYYKIVEPGTYMYHCHVEATEHMEMGMLGSLHVRPAQNRLPNGTVLGSWVHQNPDNLDGNTPRNQDDPLVGTKYVYNDGDGSTRYDVEFNILMEDFDRNFHEEHIDVQPLPFSDLRSDYPMLNGRGYPDTINPDPLPAPDVGAETAMMYPNGVHVSQKESSLITATQGQRILLRMANLSVTRFTTLGTTGVPMKVVGKSAKLYRGPDGKNLYYDTTSITLGGGESLDAIIDTTDLAVGEYYLYATNLDQLKNDQDQFGGMMTKIVIQAP